MTPRRLTLRGVLPGPFFSLPLAMIFKISWHCHFNVWYAFVLVVYEEQLSLDVLHHWHEMPRVSCQLVKCLKSWYVCFCSIRGAAVAGCAAPLARDATCGLSAGARTHRDQGTLQPGQAGNRTGEKTNTRAHLRRERKHNSDVHKSHHMWINFLSRCAKRFRNYCWCHPQR